MSTVTYSGHAAESGGLSSYLHRVVDALARRRADRRAAQHLSRLDDRLLRDVGLTREEVAELFHR